MKTYTTSFVHTGPDNRGGYEGEKHEKSIKKVSFRENEGQG